MRKSEQDYPSKAAFVDSLKWWEIMRITAFHAYRKPIPLPENYGAIKRFVVNLNRQQLSNGKLNWKPEATVVILLAVVFAGVWLLLSIPVGDAAIWLWFFFSLLIGISIGVWGSVLAFRSGGWEQVLEEREKKLAWKKKQKSLREGYPNQ